VASELSAASPRRFRDVLGHYPTGVALVTAIDQDGRPVGLTVGSFTSVSLDPPLVAYLPARSSTRFARLREAAAFCVNILAADQENLCRDFARSGADPFDRATSPVAWAPAPSGAPRLDGVVGWIDCTTESVQEAGDHWLVMGRVTDLDIENPTSPLLFFQGGYGAFATRSLVVSPREQLEAQVRLADLVRDELSALSDEMRVETHAYAVSGDEQVLVAVALPPESHFLPMRVGTRWPMIPPWNAAYLAWESADEIERQCACVKPALTPERRIEFDRELALIREHGWALSHREDERLMRELASVLEAQQRFGHTPDVQRRLAEAVSRMTPHADPASLDDNIAAAGLSITAPVFDADGHVSMLLVAFELPVGTTANGVRQCRDRLLDIGTSATARSGGRPPDDYVVLH
jgi:flavin reductase (DIM6/NTAB) family NADH-FMN oxidoreductase RutF